MISDFTGGVLLFGGGSFVFFSVYRAIKDQEFKGVHPAMMLYYVGLNGFFVWFFADLGQPWSAAGQAWMTLAEGVWLALYVKYQWWRKL